jgi:serine protease AprX
MRKLRLLLAPVLACTLLVSTLGAPLAAASTVGAQVTLDPSLKIHPLLQFGAQTDPNRVVRVIIQQVRPPGSNLLGGLLGGLLGSTDEQFTIIPAVVKSVKLSSIAALAKDSNVRYISPDGPVQVDPGLPIVGSLLTDVLGILGTSKNAPTGSNSATKSTATVDSTHLTTTYPFDTGATAAWGRSQTGAGVTVAVLDSGVDASHPDLAGHVLAVNVNNTASGPSDGYGHGTHVAGIIGGQDPTGQNIGIAPRATVISVKLSDDSGAANESDVLRGLQWVELNRSSFHIRAINLSVTTSVPQSYATSPIDAAIEHLWYEGVTTVVSAGNLGTAQDAVWYAPGNDPLAISVGCLDENATTSPADDSLCPISSRGITEDGFAKPDLLAPGRKIVAPLAKGVDGKPSGLALTYPERITADGHHIRLSGTSMSTPMVTGAIALLLQRHPNLTPDQLKQILVGSASSYPGQTDGAGTLNLTRALSASDSPPPAKITMPVPQGGVAQPSGSGAVLWDGSRWTGTTWDGSRWTSAYWDGSRWTSAHWDGAQWDGSRWTNAYWDSAHWDSSQFDSAHWDSAHWDGSRWTSAYWDSAHWDSAHWDGSSWD